MTIFDHISSILYKKKDSLENEEDEKEYSPYMINKWLSMYSPQMATVINKTSNKYYAILEDKFLHHKFLKSILPKMKWEKIEYIKKDKKKTPAKKEQEINNTALLAQSLEISEREVKYLQENL